jgi:hypothetical protein
MRSILSRKAAVDVRFLKTLLRPEWQTVTGSAVVHSMGIERAGTAP